MNPTGLFFSIAVAMSVSPLIPVTADRPSIAQTVSYRYSETIITPKKTMHNDATVTLTSAAENAVRATIAVDEMDPESLAFRVGTNGEWEPLAAGASALPSGNHTGEGEQHTAVIQTLLARLSIAARITAHPGGRMSFPIRLDIPGASSPLSSTLFVASTPSDTIDALATAQTFITPANKKRKHRIPLGAGFLAGVAFGTPGRIVALAGTAIIALTATHRTNKPLPADVRLHITGRLSAGRMQTLSGDQAEVVHTEKGDSTLSDMWSFEAL